MADPDITHLSEQTNISDRSESGGEISDIDTSLPMNDIDIEESLGETKEEPSPAKVDPPMSLARVAVYTGLISLGMLLLIFLINGGFVAFGIYRLYATSGQAAIGNMSIYGLEDMDARISFDANLKTDWFSKLVGFELKRPSKVQVIVPQMKSSRYKETIDNSVVVEVGIPPIKYNRGDEQVQVRDLHVKINEEIPMGDLMMWYNKIRNL